MALGREWLNIIVELEYHFFENGKRSCAYWQQSEVQLGKSSSGKALQGRAGC